jgi:hypothetical protein
MKKSRRFFVHLECNEVKQGALRALRDEYRRYLKTCIDGLLGAHLCNVPKSSLRSFFPKEAVLSTNIVTCVHLHAIGIIKGWFRSRYSLRLKHEVKRLFREGLIDDDFRRQLFTIGKCGVSKPSARISQESIDFYWAILLDPKIGGQVPTVPSRVGMRMSVHTSDLRKVETTKLTSWWLGFSGLLRGRRVQLPLNANPFVKSIDDLTHGFLVQEDRRGRWFVQGVETKETPEAEPPELSAPRVAVDVGLNVLAATSDGRVYGREVKQKFDKRYAQVRQVRANRQRQGLPLNSKRLDCLEDRLSGLVKTSTGRIANQLVKDFPEHVFVLEDLDLRGCKGQKRFAYKALQANLARKAPTYLVNPAYTSQECPSCHSVSRGNRNGTTFRCLSCGRKSHADVVGAINLLRRSEDKQIDCDSLPSEVKTLLLSRRVAPRPEVGNHALPSLQPSAHYSGRPLRVCPSTAVNAEVKPHV